MDAPEHVPSLEILLFPRNCCRALCRHTDWRRSAAASAAYPAHEFLPERPLPLSGSNESKSYKREMRTVNVGAPLIPSFLPGLWTSESGQTVLTKEPLHLGPQCNDPGSCSRSHWSESSDPGGKVDHMAALRQQVKLSLSTH